MIKEARLSAIMMAVKENEEKKAQALYGAELSLRTGEWAHLISCASKLIAVDAQNIILNNEALQLQKEIEEEREKEILEGIT